ncbi:response regulator [Pseudothauera rhizosphaerae]|nr:response regulator [Pseudothauera rhizosphaerae]
MNVLVVDDNREIWARLISLLGDGPLPDIAYAGRLAEARVLLREGAPQLVVLEIHLPDGCGLELLHELRHCRPAVPVVVFSNHTELSAYVVAHGASLFLDKSLDFPGLLDLLKSLVAPPTSAARPLAA